MKHVTITGGAGFIGSHLCEAMLAKGYAVTALDNFITGRPSNVAHLMADPHFQLVECDVSERLPEHQMRNLSLGLHGVFHFACPASPVDFQKIPFEILAVDSVGTALTVDLALRHGARYILASTSEIYGDPAVHPQPEEYFGNVNTLGPRACYDEAKRFAEAYVSSAMRGSTPKRGPTLNAGIVRIFNTYGPRMRPDDGRIIPMFISRGLAGAELPVCGDGLQTRSFCYVTDLVAGIVKLFESGVRDAVNIGNPDERSVLEIAEIIRRMTGGRSSVTYVPARQDDPRQRCPIITRATERLGWTPTVGLLAGLANTVEYFRTIEFATPAAVANPGDDAIVATV